MITSQLCLIVRFSWRATRAKQSSAQALFVINGWYEPSDSVDEEESVLELWVGQQEDSGSEGEEETKDHRSEWVSAAESYTSSASDDYGRGYTGP